MTAQIKSRFKDDRYYLRYKLERDPFPAAQDDILYLTPQINRRVERIREAIAGSHKVIVMTSSPGAGKSVLAEYLESVPEINWKISLVQAESAMSSEKLAYSIINKALPDKADKPALAIPMLHKYLELSSRTDFLPVFIIDDADKLPLETLRFLLELATLRYGESRFRIVLFADESLNDRLDDPALDNLAAGMIFSLHLPSLSREQTREYLDTRLNAAGEISDYPFDEAGVDYIYHISGGLPASISLAAREIMQVVPEPEAPPQSYTARIAAGAGITAVAAVLLYFLLVVQPGVEKPAPAVTTTITEPEVVSTTGPETDAGVETVANTIPEAENSESPIPVAEDSPQEIAPMAETVPEKPVTAQTDSTGTELTTVPTTSEDVADITEPASAVSAFADTAAAESVTPPAMPVTAAGPPTDESNIYNLDTVPSQVAGIRGNSWYRTQARTAYTLQLISASSIDNVIELLNDNPGNQANLSGYVKYTPSGFPRYLLFYGLYRDKEEATAAIAGLPAGLQAVNPWPRSIGNITDEIDTVVLPPR
jgi:type II secretory pathway predicted ATPase ExeA/septal ring-binding cell division protein DamX